MDDLRIEGSRPFEPTIKPIQGDHDLERQALNNLNSKFTEEPTGYVHPPIITGFIPNKFLADLFKRLGS